MNRYLEKTIEQSLVETCLNHLKKRLIFFWNKKISLEIKITNIGECDNGKELDDPDYNEYEGIFVSVIKIVSCTASKDEINNLLGPIPYEGIGYVIAFNNAPDLILDSDIVIWKKPKIPNHAQSDMYNL